MTQARLLSLRAHHASQLCMKGDCRCGSCVKKLHQDAWRDDASPLIDIGCKHSERHRRRNAALRRSRAAAPPFRRKRVGEVTLRGSALDVGPGIRTAGHWRYRDATCESSSGRRRASLAVPDDGLDATATRILRFVRGLVG
jgi:hypothetical protein